MKYALICIVAAIVIFTACKKKGTPTHCYACKQYDSFTSRTTGGINVIWNGFADTQCNRTQGLINLYVESNVQADSFYQHTDSVAFGYLVYHCVLAE